MDLGHSRDHIPGGRTAWFGNLEHTHTLDDLIPAAWTTIRYIRFYGANDVQRTSGFALNRPRSLV
jgi:hypothetical protein